jgi:hypothetical protein
MPAAITRVIAIIIIESMFDLNSLKSSGQILITNFDRWFIINKNKY